MQTGSRTRSMVYFCMFEGIFW